MQTPSVSPSSNKGTIDDETNLYAAPSIALSGRYAYVVSKEGDAGKKNFAVIDVSNPASPAVVGSINDDTSLYLAYTVAVSGRYAYVVSNNAAVAGKKEFVVIDISNPAVPAVVGTIDDDVNLYLALSVTVSGRYAYVVSNNDATAGKKEFAVIDISNPAVPAVVGTIDDDTGLYKATSIAVSGRYAYVVNSDGTGGKKNFAVVDIGNPTFPSVVGSIDDDTNLYFAHSVAVSGRYAYVANGDVEAGKKTFAVIDIKNPASPAVVGTIDDDTNLYTANSVAVSGRYAYVANNGGGVGQKNFAVVDIGTPASPVVVGSIDDETNLVNAWSVAVSGRYAYVADKDAAGGGSPKNFAVIDLSGLDVTSASIGSLEAGALTVRESAVIANGLSVGTGLNVGVGGIFSDGALAVNGTSSPSYFGGPVMIATTTTSTVSAKLTIGGQYYSVLKTIPSSASFTADWNNGNVQEITLTGNATATLSNGLAGGRYTLVAKQDGTGGRILNWPSSVKWVGGVSPSSTMATSASAVNTFTLTYDGTNYEGSGHTFDARPAVGIWRMEEGAGTSTADSSGNGNAGTLINMADPATATSGWTTSGKFGNALNFDGTNDRVSIGSDVIGTGADSISAWIYARSYGGASFGRIEDNGQTLFYLNNINGANIPGLRFTSNGATNAADSAAGSIQLSTWYHVVATRNSSGTANLYINGVLSGTANQASGAPVAGTTNVQIGGRTADNARNFDGLIDEVRVYNRVLTATEIRAVMLGYTPAGN